MDSPLTWPPFELATLAMQKYMAERHATVLNIFEKDITAQDIDINIGTSYL